MQGRWQLEGAWEDQGRCHIDARRPEASRRQVEVRWHVGLNSMHSKNDCSNSPQFGTDQWFLRQNQHSSKHSSFSEVLALCMQARPAVICICAQQHTSVHIYTYSLRSERRACTKSKVPPQIESKSKFRMRSFSELKPEVRH